MTHDQNGASMTDTGTPRTDAAAARERIQDCKPHDCIADLLVRQKEKLQSEVEMLTKAGVIECMVRNRAVSERIAQLERELASLTTSLSERTKELERYTDQHSKCCVAMVKYVPVFGWLHEAIERLGKRVETAESALSVMRGERDEANSLLIAATKQYAEEANRADDAEATAAKARGIIKQMIAEISWFVSRKKDLGSKCCQGTWADVLNEDLDAGRAFLRSLEDGKGERG